jgi:hypothetical protein
MTVPLLLNALQIAWVRLLRDEEITPENLETAPLRVVAAVLEASADGETDPNVLADAAVAEWTTSEAASFTLN